MGQRGRLLALLADGRFHSGETLGRELGVGRGAVWKLVRSLRACAVPVWAVRGRGYRLAAPVELLERERLLAELGPPARTLLNELELLPEVDSTNRYLMERGRRGAACGHACLAEYQSGGRGRRGREWISPPAANIYLSLLWHFESVPEAMHGLSLAAGVAAARALRSLGVVGIGLKWPNDLVLDDRKLGGLLIEMEGEAEGPLRVVTGVGVNVRMPPSAAGRIDQPWTDLGRAGMHPGRNRLAGGLLGTLLEGMDRFSREGFAPFREDWDRFDRVRGNAVHLHGGNGVIRGHARGVDETGALLLSVDGRLRRFVSGEVSLRLAP